MRFQSRLSASRVWECGIFSIGSGQDDNWAMMETRRPEPPRLNRRYACIADRESLSLAAVVSSYLFVPGTYLPLFLLRKVRVAHREEEVDFLSEAYVAELMAGEDSVFIGNALARIGAPEYVILAGLNEAQRSYLRLPEGTALVEISDLSEVESKLSPITDPREELKCRSDDILGGLAVAQRLRRRLVLDEQAPPLPEVALLDNAAVVVERLDDPNAVIAINYGNGVNANVFLVDPLAKHDVRQIQNWIQDWKENGSLESWQRLRGEIESRIGRISFSRFEYVTFFTTGLPYSLVLDDLVPCTYVHLSFKPDLFVLNSILFSDGERYGSAVVFSPTFFVDEETGWLCEFFRSESYYLRALIAQDATMPAFDFGAQYFPYDLLHICSHGGEVEGYEMSERFMDRDGKTHTVDFEEVVGFTPVPGNPNMVEVHRKVFPRALDGLPWMSAELENQGLPSHVSLDMWKCMLESKGRRRPKGRIVMSCAIACADTIHQGQFHALASYSSPIVFNNTCWSSYEVAAFFIACGARGYIGTLWAVGNDDAVLAAQTFYENLFSSTVLSAFRKATQAISGTPAKGIYVYWGLHFAEVPPSQGYVHARNEVHRELLQSVHRWLRKVESTKIDEVRRSSIRVLRLLVRELLRNFPSPVSTRAESIVRLRVPDYELADIPGNSEEPPSPLRRRSIDCPAEFRQKSGLA